MWGNRKFEIEYLSLEALTKPKPPRAALAPLTPVNFLTSERKTAQSFPHNPGG